MNDQIAYHGLPKQNGFYDENEVVLWITWKMEWLPPTRGFLIDSLDARKAPRPRQQPLVVLPCWGPTIRSTLGRFEELVSKDHMPGLGLE